MKWMMIWMLALPAVLVVGCSSGQDPEPKPPQKTVFDPLIQNEQRARDVQQAVDENTARVRKTVEAQERGDAAP